MPKPNFLIVGAAKSGTTSLYEYLRTHPDVFMPARKEPSHFVPEAGGISDFAEYLELFRDADGYKRIGEASVSYLMAPGAPAKIAAALGTNIKIVILLRNPVAAAYSFWGHNVRLGVEMLPFQEAVRAETLRLDDPLFQASCRTWVYNLAYTERGKYFEQVHRYLEIFGRENVGIYFFEEFYQPNLPQYGSLCDFLGIASNHRPTLKKHNQSGTARSKFIRRVMYERMAWKEPFKLILPVGLRVRIMAGLDRLNRRNIAQPTMPKEAARLVATAVADDVAQLAVLTGRPDLPALWEFDFAGQPAMIHEPKFRTPA